MRISRIGAVEILAPARHSAGRHESDVSEVSEARALVAIEPVAAHAGSRALPRHPAAPFIAQLLATRMRMPQTRTRRRAEPEEAIAAYRQMMGRRRI